MKKVFLAVLCFTALCFSSKTVNAQAGTGLKIGVFDFDIMIQALPEYRSVDSLTQIYQRDTLGAEYQIYVSEYQRLDSTWKSDSAAKKPQAVLDYTGNQRDQMRTNLIYWQQLAQQKSNDYQGRLLAPSYQKILAAYKKVIAVKKYDLILKPDSYELGSKVENMFPLVAKELNITLPPGLMGDPNQALNEAGAGTGMTKPQQ